MSFYTPAKDLFTAIRSRRVRGLRSLDYEVQQMGETTLVIVWTQCKPGATAPVQVRSCRVERYEKAFDSCVEAEPVLERTVRFSPGGSVTIKPGDPPHRWEARFLTEHLRRSVRKDEDAATVRELGVDALETKYDWEQLEATRRSSDHLLPRLLGAIEGPPRVRLRVVLELVDLAPVESAIFEVPPPSPLLERLRTALRG
jgi:hypothetical protein